MHNKAPEFCKRLSGMREAIRTKSDTERTGGILWGSSSFVVFVF